MLGTPAVKGTAGSVANAALQLSQGPLGGPENRGLVACRYERCYTPVMSKRLQAIGNSAGIIIDKPILELLRITPDTELELKTDGQSLIITPVRESPSRAQRLAKVQSKVVRKHERTFRKLAK